MKLLKELHNKNNYEEQIAKTRALFKKDEILDILNKKLKAAGQPPIIRGKLNESFFK